jgi:hypothetical protein
MMRAQRVNLLHGWMWFKQGVWLFRRNPFLWMFLTSIFVVGLAGIAMLPVLGPFLLHILFPAFFAGLMIGAHALAEEKPLEIRHLFAGFQQHGTPLITLGIIATVALLLVAGLVEVSGGAELLQLVASGKQPASPEELQQALSQAGIMFPVAVLAFIILQTSVPFAAMLVVFRQAPPLAALGAALRATLLNFLPLLIYSLMLAPVAILASVPAMLGWLVLLPILIGSQYAIYRDMFPMPGDAGAPQP